MKIDNVIEKIILNGEFNSLDFSISTIDKYLKDKNEILITFNKIIEIREYVELICDRQRTMNNTTFDFFVKLLSKKYTINNNEVLKSLFSYGLFVTR